MNVNEWMSYECSDEGTHAQNIHYSATRKRAYKNTGAIPFNIHTPLWTRSIKFEPLRKKIKVPTQTPPEIKKFLP
jgi:hypothetical protein